DAPKQEVIEPEELEPYVPPNSLTRNKHSNGELHHILIDTQRHIPSSSIPMGQVSVLMRQHGAELILAEARQQAEPHHKNTSPELVPALLPTAPFEDSHIRSRSHAYLIKRPRPEILSNFACQRPQPRRFLQTKTAPRFLILNSNEQ